MMMSMAEGFSKAMQKQVERDVAARVVADYVPASCRRSLNKSGTKREQRAA
jgi:hypothetical protein